MARKRRMTRESCRNRSAPRGDKDERRPAAQRSCDCRAGEGQEAVERARARSDRVDLAIAMARLLRTCLGQASVGMTVPAGAASAIIFATSVFQYLWRAGGLAACLPARDSSRRESTPIAYKTVAGQVSASL